MGLHTDDPDVQWERGAVGLNYVTVIRPFGLGAHLVSVQRADLEGDESTFRPGTADCQLPKRRGGGGLPCLHVTPAVPQYTSFCCHYKRGVSGGPRVGIPHHPPAWTESMQAPPGGGGGS